MLERKNQMYEAPMVKMPDESESPPHQTHILSKRASSYFLVNKYERYGKPSNANGPMDDAFPIKPFTPLIP